VSANAGVTGTAALALVPLVLLAAATESPGTAVRTGAATPEIADVMLVCTPVTVDFVSSTSARVSWISAAIVRLNSSLRALVVRRKSAIARPT
jgi:hypothetical protein